MLGGSRYRASGSLGMTHRLGTILCGVSATDPAVFVAASVFFLAMAAVAAYPASAALFLQEDLARRPVCGSPTICPAPTVRALRQLRRYVPG